MKTVIYSVIFKVNKDTIKATERIYGSEEELKEGLKFVIEDDNSLLNKTIREK